MPSRAGLYIAAAGLGLTLLINFAAVAYWGGSLSASMKDVQQRMERMERRLDSQQISTR